MRAHSDEDDAEWFTVCRFGFGRSCINTLGNLIRFRGRRWRGKQGVDTLEKFGNLENFDLRLDFELETLII